MTFDQMKEAREIMSIIRTNGGTTYLVGGYIRDMELGMAPSDVKDIDIATDLPPEILYGIQGINARGIGLQGSGIGVVGCNLHNSDTMFEVATLRADQYEGGSFTTKFGVTIDEDLARRDFTMNAIALEVRGNGENIKHDPYNGTSDISMGIIKAVGDPLKRFKEDPTRILRACRFKARLDFCIDKDTFKAMADSAHLIKTIPVERIREEIIKIVNGKYSKDTIQMMGQLGVWNYILPALNDAWMFDQKSKYHNETLLGHISTVVENVHGDYRVKMAALLHDIGKLQMYRCSDNGSYTFAGHAEASSNMARRFLIKYKFSNKDVDVICKLIENHMHKIQPMKKKGMGRLIRRVGEENLSMLMNLWKADTRELYMDNVLALIGRINDFREHTYVDTSGIMVNGYDLMKLGYMGKDIKEVQERLMEDVHEGKVKNNKTSLLEYLK